MTRQDAVLAIDFGTSFTSAALSIGGEPPTVVSLEGAQTMPSLVAFDEGGRILVGEAADSQSKITPDSVEEHLKRALLLGRKRLVVGDARVPVEEVLAAVFAVPLEMARGVLGGDLPGTVVLTYPVIGISDVERAIMERAARRAGVTGEVTFLAEPVAAAQHFLARRAADAVDEGGHIAVYDLGGGTFDVAVLRWSDGRFEVSGTPTGLQDVGGAEFDVRLCELVLGRIAEIDPEAHEQLVSSTEARWRRARRHLQREVRRAKERLAWADHALVAMPYAIEDRGVAIEGIVVSRSEFETMIRHDLERSMTTLEDALGAVSDDVFELCGLYLVGGASRIRLVREMVTERFGRADTEDDPKAVIALGAARPKAEPMPAAPPRPRTPRQKPQPIADRDVQFTVYRPRVVPADVWRHLLVFAHKTDPVTGPDGQTTDPLEEVRRQADEMLGGRLERFLATRPDIPAEIVRGTDLRFVPEVDGVEFNPGSATFAWLEPVHAQVFRLRAHESLEGTTARGALRVYGGPLLVAEVPLALRVERGATDHSRERSSARRFGTIFASYSHLDEDVVARIEEFSDAVGMEFLRDRRQLRAGDDWEERLEEMIRDADVFQLFWSHNALRSTYVEAEWRYALSLGRPGFIKPVCWHQPPPPLPRPPELDRLHFARLEAVASAQPRTAAAPSAPPPRGRSRGLPWSWLGLAVVIAVVIFAAALIVSGRLF